MKILLVSVAAFGWLLQAQSAEPKRKPDAGVATWPQWRGPHRDGHAGAEQVPLQWGGGHNLKWQLELPGFGNSSPVVCGDLVFLTAATKTGSERWVLAVDRKSGKVLWQQTAAQGLAAEPVHAWNTHASATCATDGERVYAFFGTPGLFCYDFKGKLLWKRDFGPLASATGWGAGAASPILFEDLVIVNGDQGAQRGQRSDKGVDYGASWLWALDKRPGELVWKTDGQGNVARASWGPTMCVAGWRPRQGPLLERRGDYVRHRARARIQAVAQK